MANTNLYQSNKLPGASSSKGISLDKGMVFSGILLILVLAVYGGTSWYSKSLEKKKLEIDSKITSESESLRSPEASLVADFQKRLTKIDENLKLKKNPTEILNVIEKSIIPEAVIKSLNIDNEKSELKILVNVDNFRSMARQILLFKRENLSDDISVTEVGRDQDGRIDFLLSGNLKIDNEGTSADTLPVQ